jgi:uncharacterized protein DUF4143
MQILVEILQRRCNLTRVALLPRRALDLRHLAEHSPPADRRTQNLLAAHTAQLLSYSNVARDLGVAVNPALARLLGEQAAGANGALFETAVLDQLLRWSSWQPDPPALHFFRTHAGREVDFVLHAPDRLLAIEVKASPRAHRTDARSLIDVLGTLAPRGIACDARRLGLVVTRGREVESLAPGVWAVPNWRLFGPAG